MLEFSLELRKKNHHCKISIANSFGQKKIPIEKVFIGNNTYDPLHVVPYKSDFGSFKIGHYCSIVRAVKFLLRGSHHYSRLSTFPLKLLINSAQDISYSKGDIIEDDAWIGEDLGVKIV